jgi:hypothetical protein
MSTKNVLVVALDEVPDEDVRQAIEARKAVSDVNVLVVAPTTHVGALRWLTGDEDEARAEAGELADRAAEAIDAEVHAEVGDHDPLLAVEDALRTFPADEIVVAGLADEDTQAALERFQLPISRLRSAAETTDEDAASAEPLPREVTRGRGSKTPVVLLAMVLGVVAAAIVVISLIVYLVVWLT